MYSHNRFSMKRAAQRVEFYRSARVDWLTEWATRDFSWDGLANQLFTFRTPDGRQLSPFTLQDFWREEEHRLLDAPDGKKYTRFHYPFWVVVDGYVVKTEKSEWSEDVWAELEASLVKKVANYNYAIVDGKIMYREQDGNPGYPNPVTDPAAPIHIDFSGIACREYIKEFTSSTSVILKQIYFENCRFRIAGHGMPTIRLIDCFVDGDIQAERLGGLNGIEIGGCWITGRIDLSGSQIDQLQIWGSECSSLWLEDCKIGSLALATNMSAPEDRAIAPRSSFGTEVPTRAPKQEPTIY
jgi:hypothetical protein